MLTRIGTQCPIFTDPAKMLQDIYPDYELLLWKANNEVESLKIKWKQRNSMKMCVSLTYLLEDESKCTFSMDLTNEDSFDDKQVIYSNNIKESVTWPFTCITYINIILINYILFKSTKSVFIHFYTV